MNVKTIDNINKTPKTRNFRRSLAIICAVVIAMLQCAVILTVDDVHGASIDVKVQYKDGTSITNNVTVKSSNNVTFKNYTSTESTVVKGRRLDYFLNDAGIQTDKIINIEIGGKKYTRSMLSLYMITSGELDETKGNLPDGINPTLRVVPYGSVKFYDILDSAPTASGSISVNKTGVNSVRTLVFSGLPDKPEKGKPYTFRVDVEGTDKELFNNSNEGKQIKSNLVVKSDNPSIATVAQNGDSYVLTVNKGGSFKIIANAGGVEEKTEVGAVEKISEDKVKITKNGTLKKGKDYSNSQLKEKLKVTVDGEPLSDDNWDVIKQSTKDGKIHVTIELKNGYEGTFSESFYLSGSSGSSGNSGGGSSWRPRSYNSNGITRSTTNSSLNGTTTGTTVPNVTYAPDRTITVKEVTLGGKIEDQTEQTDPANQGYIDPMEDGSSSEPDMTSENTPMTLGPTAGSAAVAAAACGAGVVGRIRRFKLDTAMAAVEEITTEGE